MQIAIDGPAGSGKSTVAKIIAEKCGITYLDTGAMYRAAALIALKYNLSAQEILPVLKNTSFNFSCNGRKLELIYNINGVEVKKDVTTEIRSESVTGYVSTVAANPALRAVLTEKQRAIARSGDVVMDGRDIGTAVLPNADFKFFLTAAPEERAKRRAVEWGVEPCGKEYENILNEILKRDAADSSRATAPLEKASDAKEIDTTHLTIDEVVDIIYAVVKMHI